VAKKSSVEVGKPKDYIAKKLAAAQAVGYVGVQARVDLVGFEPPNGGTFVSVQFTPPPPGGPLGVSTVWDPKGVDYARFALAHNKKLLILYKGTGFGWSDIVDLAILR